MNRICFGCGAKFQSLNINEDGYIPSGKEKSANYCQRCFKIIHYGIQSKSSTPKETDIIINSIYNDNKFVIFLVDFLSINSEVIEIFNKIKNDKILVISKVDLILKSIKEVHIKSFLKNYYKITSYIKLISSYNNYGVESLTKYLFKKNINSAYIVGLTNSGKSTLINKLIEANNSNMKMITTSYIPNTTLDFIRIKINKDLMIIDSPGFIINTIQNEIITPKNSLKVFLKPKTFQMKAGETLQIEDMYLNFNNNTSVTLYLSNDLKLKKYFKEVIFDYSININQNKDLIISGLGFLNIKSQTKVNIKNINKELIEIRNSVFGDIYE
ncbi:MAG: 50S ribosome-binding GTPase [Bacilli bacterium]|nr:50S ribosome-binding GTPase [Bacilli bacterium]